MRDSQCGLNDFEWGDVNVVDFGIRLIVCVIYTHIYYIIYKYIQLCTLLMMQSRTILMIDTDID